MSREDGACKHCNGTGQPNGIMGGPEHGLCGWCNGSGLEGPTAEQQMHDTMRQRIATLTAERDELVKALEPVWHWYNSDEHHDRPLVDVVRDVIADLQEDRADSIALRKSGRNLLAMMVDTYKAKNGREIGIQGDDGEKCYIVHSDQIEELRATLTRIKASS